MLWLAYSKNDPEYQDLKEQARLYLWLYHENEYASYHSFVLSYSYPLQVIRDIEQMLVNDESSWLSCQVKQFVKACGGWGWVCFYLGAGIGGPTLVQLISEIASKTG